MFQKILQKKIRIDFLILKSNFFSKSLVRPIETTDIEAIDKLLQYYKIKDMKPRYETVIENDYIGKVAYYQFKLDFLP